MAYPRIILSSTVPSNRGWQTGFLRAKYSLRHDPNTNVTTASAGKTAFKTWDDPLAALDWMSKTFAADSGRWIGFLNYDLGRHFETLPAVADDDLNLPLFAFDYCVPIQDNNFWDDPTYSVGDEPLASNYSREEYEQTVLRILEYIAAGDVFQINLAQRFSVGMKYQPLDSYRWLVQNAPARFSAFLAYPDFALVSNSPELFLKITPDDDGHRTVVNRPIKGTRPLGDGMAEALRASAKDQAELAMIVDLQRNDLGRVCEVGSVKVTEPRAIETLPTLHHAVATIEGVLRPDVGFVDLLRATFPCGSITGCPKIRAMEIIDELEPVRRGPYCGAIGYLSKDGTIELSVAIRTIVIKDGRAHVSVGGGIVADSDPAMEYEETLVKARAMFAALGIAEVSGQ